MIVGYNDLYLNHKRRAIAAEGLTVVIKWFERPISCQESLRVCASGKDESQNRIRRIEHPSGQSYTPRHSESAPRTIASAIAHQATLATARGADLQVLYNKLQHHLAHVPDQARIGHPVAGFRVGHELELLAGLLQLVNELDRILQRSGGVARNIV